MNAINWFELFVSDFERARRFYEQALATPLETMDGMGGRMALFPCNPQSGVGGCLSDAPEQQSGIGGTRVYLNVEGQLAAVVNRVPAAGGTIIQGKMSIAPHGFIAVIKDSEGNEVGLHSMS
ncbi:VOC family protein [Pseudomonas sp.]|uniref:VOC family protein n=1 Tax=Pseudomonas sp. TaxID=306 RepID=UPI0035696C8B